MPRQVSRQSRRWIQMFLPLSKTRARWRLRWRRRSSRTNPNRNRKRKRNSNSNSNNHKMNENNSNNRTPHRHRHHQPSSPPQNSNYPRRLRCHHKTRKCKKHNREQINKKSTRRPVQLHRLLQPHLALPHPLLLHLTPQPLHPPPPLQHLHLRLQQPLPLPPVTPPSSFGA